MSSVRYKRVQDIFGRACELPGAERAAFLDEACRDEPGLRAEVDELLAHDDRPIDFVDRALVDGGADVLARDLPGAGDAPAPERIGRYRILRVIGSGGMGVVYEAEQDEPKRRVALKVIRSGIVTPSLLRRFRHEAQVLGQLRHPGIAQIFEAGTADTGHGGQPFFAMELVAGRPLLEHAAAERLGRDERLALFAAVCDASHHAHQKGVIHRDLKPDNILVETPGGQPKILDFGVARATDADLQTVTVQTTMGQLVGTVPYMSPEQASGDPDALDVRSDIYGLGVILYELLAGRLPYAVRDRMIHEAVRVIREDEPSRLSSVSRTFRGDVETIVAKALEKDKERRYQSAAELAADIRRFLSNEPIVARPASALYQLRKLARRNRAVATGVAIAFVTMILATAVSVWQAGVARIAEADATEKGRIAETRADALYESTIASALRAIEYGDATVGRAALAALGESARGTWEYRYLAARLDQAVALLECRADVSAAVFDAEGAVVTADASGTLRRWDGRTGTIIDEIQLDAESIGPAAFSRHGARLAALVGPDRNEAGVWDTARGERIATYSVDGTSLIAISADGRLIGLGPRNGQIRNVDDGTRIDVPIRRGRGGRLAFSGDGRRLVYSAALGSGQLHLWTFDVETGATKAVKETYTSPGSLVVTSGGVHAIVGVSDQSARMIEVASGRTARIFAGHSGTVSAVAIDDGERRLVTGSTDRTIRVWDLATGEARLALTGPSARIDAVCFSPDGHLVLAAAGGEVRVFELDQPAGSTVLRGHESYVYGVGVVGDGRRVVSGAWDSDLRIWDPASGACRVVPSGRRIYAAVAGDAPFVATAHHALICLWDPDTGEHLRNLEPACTNRVTALDMTPDGATLASRQHKCVSILDTETGDLVMQIPLRVEHQEFGCVAISPDGTRVAASESGGRVVICDVATGDVVRRIPIARNRFEDLAFSADGTRLAAGGRDGKARIWDARSGELIAELAGHASKVWAVAFTADGRRLATGSEDRLIMLWDVERGTRVLTLAGHDDYVYDLAFASDDSILVSGSGDSTVRVWQTRPRWARSGAPTEPTTGRPLP